MSAISKSFKNQIILGSKK